MGRASAAGSQAASADLTRRAAAWPLGSWTGSCTPAALQASEPGDACLQQAGRGGGRGREGQQAGMGRCRDDALMQPAAGHLGCKFQAAQGIAHGHPAVELCQRGCMNRLHASALDPPPPLPIPPETLHPPEAGKTVASSLSSSSTRGAGQASARSTGSRRHSERRSCARCRRARARVAA